MNVTSVNYNQQSFGAAKVNLKSEYLMPKGKGGQKQADYLRKSLNRMMEVPVLAEAMKEAPDGTEISAFKMQLGNMFGIMLRKPGEQKYKTLFAIFPDQMGKQDIKNSARLVAKKLQGTEQQPNVASQLHVA